MAIELKMPALSPTMEKGALARWLVQEGEVIESGKLIAEIETDKATVELEAEAPGRIAKLLVPEGSDEVAVGTVIALLADDGEAVEPPTDRVPATGRQGASVAAADVGGIAEPIRQATATDATPLARRLAAAAGLSLAGLKGSGPGGRIMKADLPLPSATPTKRAPWAAPTAEPAAPHMTQPLSGMRKTVARRLTESKQTIPHFYLTVHCRLDPLLRLRVDMNAAVESHGVKLSVNDLLIKLMAHAMVAVPDVNVQFAPDGLHLFTRVDIAVAVAIDGGLVTPVIRDAANLSLTAIARQSKALAVKARDGKLMPEEYQGGTASLSNLGMYGIDEMVPVINPPQAMILGIGAGTERPWKVDGGLGLATIVAVTGSFDHRAIDGATGARFMAAFRDGIENPLRVLG